VEVDGGGRAAQEERNAWRQWSVAFPGSDEAAVTSLVNNVDSIGCLGPSGIKHGMHILTITATVACFMF